MAFGFAKLARPVSPNGDTYSEQAKHPDILFKFFSVSNWLEEQLEALGIDSAIYTRYILSLLHADVLDVIYPEDDYFLAKLKKEGNRNTLNNKRFRRSKSWRRNIDADQIKRSAAVECLMSAAEQSCEIESLVDQLCEKLKEVDCETESSDIITNDDPSATIEGSTNEKVSPKELAEKYFAAFPALNQKSEPSYFASNINFVLDKWPSDKTRTNLIAANWTAPDSPKKSKRKLKNKNPIRRDVNRNTLKRSYRGRNLTRDMADNFNIWQPHCWYTGNFANFSNAKGLEPLQLYPDTPESDFQESEKRRFCPVQNMAVRRRSKVVQCLNFNESAMSDMSESKPKILDDSFMAESSDEESAIKEEYERPEIAWPKRHSPHCSHEESVDRESSPDSPDECIDIEFVGPVQNPRVNLTPGFVSGPFPFRSPFSYGRSSPGLLMKVPMENRLPPPPAPSQRSGDVEGFRKAMAKLNHDDSCSAFTTYCRPEASKSVVHPGQGQTAMMKLSSSSLSGLDDEEGKPTSSKSNFSGLKSEPFKPLKIDVGEERSNQRKYEDGATFNMFSTLNTMKWESSPGGSLYMQSADGVKRYHEFQDPDIWMNDNNGIQVKFEYVKHDKACQTGEDELEENPESPFVANVNLYAIRETIDYLYEDDLPAGSLELDTGNSSKQSKGEMEEQVGNAEDEDVSSVLNEVDWSCTPKSSHVFCKPCNNQNLWPGYLPKELNVGSNELKDIWNGTEMFGVYPCSSKPPTPSEETTAKLREEIREEAEELLSQLDNVSRLNVWHSEPFQQPIKRRHSQDNNLFNDGWSFASLLQEDFLASLPALPARRPVRL